jgi:hypothetical protein
MNPVFEGPIPHRTRACVTESDLALFTEETQATLKAINQNAP